MMFDLGEFMRELVAALGYPCTAMVSDGGDEAILICEGLPNIKIRVEHNGGG